MVHGNPTWSFYWRRLIAEVRTGHRAIAPDHLGCGRSDKPAAYAYRLEQHIDNLATLVERLNLEQITLVAHDWGGAIGLGAAQRMPERFRRLVLLNTGAFPPHFIPFRIRLCRTPLLGVVAMRGLNLFARAALTMAVERPLSAAARAGLLAPYDSWKNRIGIARFVQDIPLTRWHPTWTTLERIERGLSRFADTPVSLIWGMRDWCFDPSCLERFQQLLPHAETHALPDVGHYVMEDAAEQVCRLVRDALERDSRPDRRPDQGA